MHVISFRQNGFRQRVGDTPTQLLLDVDRQLRVRGGPIDSERVVWKLPYLDGTGMGAAETDSTVM